MENPLKYFAELTDPRVERNREHLLEEILLMAIAAVLSGAESWNDIRGVWPGQDRVAEDVFNLACGHSLARHVQSGLCRARSRADGEGLRGLGGIDRQTDGRGGGGHRWQ